MTARTFLNRRYRIVVTILYLGFAVFIICVLVREALHLPDWTTIPAMIAFGVAWFTMLAAWLTIFRCPSCSGNLFSLLMGAPNVWMRFDHRIQCCPYCRMEMDAELPAK